MMLIHDIFLNSSSDKMHTQETVIYSCILSLCKNVTHRLEDYGISEKWTNRTLMKWGLELGIGGWGVIWMDAGWRNGILSELAVFVGFSKELLNSNIF